MYMYMVLFRQYLVVVFRDKPLELWDVRTGTLLREMAKNFPTVTALVRYQTHTAVLLIAQIVAYCFELLCICPSALLFSTAVILQVFELRDYSESFSAKRLALSPRKPIEGRSRCGVLTARPVNIVMAPLAMTPK